MDLRAYSARLRAAAAALEAEGPRIVETMAQTARVLAQQRIQERGVAGAAYSQNLVPTFFFAKRALNAGGRQYVKKNKLGTWGGFRQAQGRQSQFVDLTYTGHMFQSLQTRRQPGEPGVFRAETVASDQESAKKLRYNLERYGNFMAPTAQEQGELRLIGSREVGGILNQYLT